MVVLAMSERILGKVKGLRAEQTLRRSVVLILALPVVPVFLLCSVVSAKKKGTKNECTVYLWGLSQTQCILKGRRARDGPCHADR